MKSNSFFYNALENSNQQGHAWIENLEKYSNANSRCVYLLRYPIVDIKPLSFKKNFMLLVPGCKISIVQESEKGEFEDYCDDIDDAILYLYQKYECRSILGRYKQLAERIVKRDAKVSDLNNIEEFIKTIEIDDKKDRRRSELLISLCIGSVNKIEDVGDDVPITLLDKVKHRIQLFDGDQTRFIFHQPRKRITKIQGLSGTGKTELLLHKLKELYTKDEGSKIFFTCHNKILADTLRKRIVEFFDYMKVGQQLGWGERLWCANAWGRQSNPNSGLYAYICDHYDLQYSGYSTSVDFDKLCEMALQSLNSMSDFEPCFDYVIVDESQDFGGNFTLLCDKIAKQGVYMAGDIFQSIFAEPIEKYDADYLLSKCYRTAPDTLMFAHALGLGLFEEQRYGWLVEQDWVACGYDVISNDQTITLSRVPAKRFEDGDDEYESVIFKNTTIQMLPQMICEIIAELQKENGSQLTPNDVAIIFIDNDDDGIYTLANQVGLKLISNFNWRANKAYENKQKIENTILISNRNNVKGLEFPYVICVTKGIKNNHSYRNLIYTMLTRSFIKSYLVTTSREAAIPQEILNGWQFINEHHKIIVKIPDTKEIQNIKMQSQKAKDAIFIKEKIEQSIKTNKLTKEQANALSVVLEAKGIYELIDEGDVIDLINESIKFIIK